MNEDIKNYVDQNSEEITGLFMFCEIWLLTK